MAGNLRHDYNLQKFWSAAEAGAHSVAAHFVAIPPNTAVLLTVAVAERAVLLTAGWWLRGGAGDGVAEHLLLGRLQHKAGRLH